MKTKRIVEIIFMLLAVQYLFYSQCAENDTPHKQCIQRKAGSDYALQNAVAGKKCIDRY